MEERSRNSTGFVFIVRGCSLRFANLRLNVT